MNGTKKIPKGQLQEGLIEMQQITSVTLFSTGWSLVSGLYEYTYTNSAILSASIVDIVPDNGSVSIVKTADILPATSSSTGSVKIYATNLPTANIIVTLNVYNNTNQSTSYSDWTRPGDWLQIPTIGTQEFIGLLAITDDESNHIALLCAGAYTVDWGDGTSQNVATGVKAEHTYTYSAISNSTLSTRGYKQVLVRVTPQSGQNLTTVNLHQQNSILAKNHAVGWLDISINGANITTLTLGITTSLIRFSMCERVTIGSIGAITSFAQLFNEFRQLQSVPLFNTASGTNFSNMFGSCNSLLTVPLFNTASGTNFTNMFAYCHSLRAVPLFNLSLAINLTTMFVYCYSLRTVPLFNTPLATTFTSMFFNCYSLQSIPLLNTSSGITFTTMFNECNSIQIIPNLNTSAGTAFTNMFSGATSISKAALQGTRYGITYSACLSQSAIVDIFNGLGTAVGTPTITISSNPGYAALTAAERLIATNKGFTIA